MQNFDKVYPNFINHQSLAESVSPRLKRFIRRLFPVVFVTFGVGFILLILQGLVIGVADRLGISPKISFLVSCLFYTATLGSLAILGGVKITEQAQNIDQSFALDKNAEAICKTLIIRRKGDK